MRFLLLLALFFHAGPAEGTQIEADEMGTPNINSIIEWLRAEYPELPRIQTTNCRRIAGSSTWSQHSWSNAADIFPLSKEQGDTIHKRLLKQFGPYIKVILWQVRNHFDHIHLDTWPTGIGTPPCAGGTLQVRHKDGRIGTVFTDDIKEGGDDMASGTRALRLAVAEAQNKGWLNQTSSEYWLGKTATPEDPEWQDFENAWAGWKLAEARKIQDGLVKPVATAGPTMTAIAADMAKRLTNG